MALPTATPILDAVLESLVRSAVPLTTHAVTLDTSSNYTVEPCTPHYFLLDDLRTDPLLPLRDDPVL